MKPNRKNIARLVTLTLVFLAGTVLGEAPLKSFGADVLVGDIVRSCPPEICALVVVPAPLPGQVRTVNKRDVAAAIQHGGGDPSAYRIPARVRVSRPAKSVSSEEMQKHVEAAVKAVLPKGFVLEELGTVSGMDVPKAGFEVRARWTGDDRFHRRVSMPIEYLSEGTKFRGAQVSALLALETEVPTAARTLNPGELVRPEDIRWKKIRLETAPGALAMTPEDIVGRLVETTVAAGAPFEQNGLKRVPVVHEGERVALESVFGLVRVSALAVSRGDGAVGDRIRVITMADNRMVWARITGPGRGRVVP